MIKTTKEILSVGIVAHTNGDIANSMIKELIRNILKAFTAAKSRSGLFSEVKLDILEGK